MKTKNIYKILLVFLIFIISPFLVTADISSGIIDYFDFDTNSTSSDSSLTSNNVITYGGGISKTTDSLIGERSLFLLQNSQRANFSQNVFNNINMRDDEFSLNFIVSKPDVTIGSSQRFKPIFRLINSDNSVQSFKIDARYPQFSPNYRLTFSISSTSIDTISLEDSSTSGYSFYTFTSNITHFKLYRDGVLVDTEPNTLSLNPNFNNFQNYFPQFSTDSSGVNLILHQMITYNKYLSNSDVQSLYNNGNGVQTEFFTFSDLDSPINQINPLPNTFEFSFNDEGGISLSSYFQNYDETNVLYTLVNPDTMQGLYLCNDQVQINEGFCSQNHQNSFYSAFVNPNGDLLFESKNKQTFFPINIQLQNNLEAVGFSSNIRIKNQGVNIIKELGDIYVNTDSFKSVNLNNFYSNVETIELEIIDNSTSLANLTSIKNTQSSNFDDSPQGTQFTLTSGFSLNLNTRNDEDNYTLKFRFNSSSGTMNRTINLFVNNEVEVVQRKSLNDALIPYSSVFNFDLSDHFDRYQVNRTQYYLFYDNNLYMLVQDQDEFLAENPTNTLTTDSFFAFVQNNGNLVIESKNQSAQIGVTVQVENQDSALSDSFTLFISGDAPTPIGPPTTDVNGELPDNMLGQAVGYISSLFPSSNSLSTSQRLGFVIITMLIIGVGIIFAMKDSSQRTLNPAVMYVLAVVESLLFIYFIAIGYIGVGVLIAIAMVLIAITYFRFRSNNAVGG